MSDIKFQYGDRVVRREDVFNPNSPLKRGTITCVYGRHFYCELSGGEVMDWNYDEMYDVVWDSGKVEKGFLPHGLDAE